MLGGGRVGWRGWERDESMKDGQRCAVAAAYKESVTFLVFLVVRLLDSTLLGLALGASLFS